MSNPTTATGVYTEDHIKTNTGLAIIRQSPTEFLPSKEHSGITHCVYEGTDNSMDDIGSEFVENGLVEIVIIDDTVNKRPVFIIRDNGRGVPLGVLHRSFTVPHTSGKYGVVDKDGNKAYKSSAGLFGVGGKVLSGTAEVFRILSSRPGESPSSASLEIVEATYAPECTFESGTVDRRGTLIMQAPSKQVFDGVDSYMSAEGYAPLIDRMERTIYFNQDRFHVKIYLAPLTKDISNNVWMTGDHTFFSNFCDKVIRSGTPLFDSETFDRSTYILKSFGVAKWLWQDRIQHTDYNVRLQQYDVQMFHAKTTKPRRIGMVNGLPIDMRSADHLSTVYRLLKQRMAPLVEGKETRTYFEESYELPVYIAVSVNYENAEFAGTTKNNFLMQDFRTEYLAHLEQRLSQESVQALYELIHQDILNQYLESIGATPVKTDTRLFMDLNKPDKFADAAARTNRLNASLVIVEGDSAGGGLKKHRGDDDEYVGIYMLGGKPLNPYKKPGVDPRHELNKNIIYQDLQKILGVSAYVKGTKDLRFGNIILLVDAD